MNPHMDKPSTIPQPWTLLQFDKQYRLVLKRDKNGKLIPSAQGDRTPPKSNHAENEQNHVRFLTQFKGDGSPRALYCQIITAEAVLSLNELDTAVYEGREMLSESLKEALAGLNSNLHQLPYLDLRENQYIYRFRTAKERNKEVYANNDSGLLYQSSFFSAIKAVRRTKEKTSEEPVVLDFGPVRYVVPSHFGFCLGVQNAIERAYEAVALNKKKRVFMLSELIHNPFVNEDLLKRGLRYLQTDKGLLLCDSGKLASGMDDPEAIWNKLRSDDIVIIPAFGATNEDKSRLIRVGLAIREYDATCMLVEKVWKSARRYASEGFTVLIHGKSEHEETKATFSNSSSHGPALIVRNMEHAKALAGIMRAEGNDKKEQFEHAFAGLYSEGFDVSRDLDRIAVVNQTTLLRNETLSIIEFFREVLAEKHGLDKVEEHIWSRGKGDTLCYATQVNQDALHKALAEPIDVALVVGGRNSSNTYQLYRVCADKLGEDAHYIQSEGDIVSSEAVKHYIFPSSPQKMGENCQEIRPFIKIPQDGKPINILLTGGASCPDGIIQQVINHINGFFAPETLRAPDAILKEINSLV
jgi:4-hydroxy-3-methylbut-2-enyl diphosphate reductase